MAEQLKAGPMTVEKQTVFYVRSRGAPTGGAGGFRRCSNAIPTLIRRYSDVLPTLSQMEAMPDPIPTLCHL